jgi:hypothetical protein
MRTYNTSRLAIASIAGALIFTQAAQADAVLDWNAIGESTVTAQAPFPQRALLRLHNWRYSRRERYYAKEYNHPRAPA